MVGDVEDKAFRRLAEQRLDEMKEFCDDKERCMVQVMLHALGDTYTENAATAQIARRSDKYAEI